MKKNFVFIVLVFTLCLTGCGDKTAGQVDLSVLRENLLSEAQLTDPLDIPEDRFQELYGVKTEDVVDSICITALGGTYADEIIVIRAADQNAAQRIADALENYKQEQMNQSRDYDPARFSLLKDCKTLYRGSVVALFLSEKHEKLETVFQQAF